MLRLFFFLALALPALAQTPQSLSLAELNQFQKEQFRQGFYKKGLPYVEELVSRVEQQYGRQDTQYYLAMHDKVNYYREVGKHLEMYDWCEQMERQIRREIGTANKFYAEAIGDLASASFFTGKGKQVIELYRKLVQLRREVYGEQHPEYARALYNLATAESTTGHLAEAESLYKEALNILQKATGSDYGNIISPLNGLGQIYAAQKRYAEAEPLYLQALGIAEKYFSKAHRRYNMVAKNLAMLYSETGRVAAAEELYRAILATLAENAGKKNIYTLAAKDLADLYIQHGQLDKAQTVLNEVVDIESTALDGRHPIRAVTYQYLARLEMAKQNWTTALQYAVEGLSVNSDKPFATTDIHEVCRQHLLDNATFRNPNFALQNLRQVAQALEALYQRTRQADWLRYQQHVCQIGIELTERIKNESQYEGDKFNFLELQSDFTLRGVQSSLELDQVADAFLLAEHNKAALLADALKSQRASYFGELPDSLLQKENYFKQTIDRLRKQYWEAAQGEEKEQLQKELNGMHQQSLQLQEFIQKNYPKYHQLKYKTFATTLPEIQEILKDDMLLIEYVLLDSVLHTFCLTKTDLYNFTQPISKTELEKQVKRLRLSLSDYEAIREQPEAAFRNYTEPARWFYEQFLAQQLTVVGDKKHLLIVPDGSLGHLPFEVFLTQAVREGQPYADLPYLVKEYQVSYSYSATLLAENCKFKCTLNPKILGIAASYKDSGTLPLRSPQQQNLRQILGDLPNAQAEVRRLENRFTGAFLYGEHASERSFKELAPDYGILHLAMHGVLDKQNPLLSALAFTENGDTVDDNFLQAHEISHLHLNALLVVLSACETGYGKFQQGEGIMSLGRAFMYAGAPALVVSLWEVNDASTAALMEDFYLNLSNNMNKAEALRQAKLSYLSNAKGFAAHPAYWSAFVQIGDSRPVQLRRQSDFMVFYFLVGVVVVAGIWAYRRMTR